MSRTTAGTASQSHEPKPAQQVEQLSRTRTESAMSQSHADSESVSHETPGPEFPTQETTTQLNSDLSQPTTGVSTRSESHVEDCTQPSDTGVEDLNATQRLRISITRTTAENSTDEENDLSPLHPEESQAEVKPEGSGRAQQQAQSQVQLNSQVQDSREVKENSNMKSDPRIELQRKSINSLKTKLTSLETELTTLRSNLANPNTGATIARHIQLLHEYNQIRDVGLGLMGMVAERRGIRVAEVLGEFGVKEGD